MTDDRLSDVLRIYKEALERDGTKRAAHLDAACGADADLRCEVEALLAEPSAGSQSLLDTPPWAPPALKAGQRLGPYEVAGLLGAGGMGIVYKARDTRLNRTVAIKVLSGAAMLDSAARERFTREARAIAALAHPHICTLYDVGRDVPTNQAGVGAEGGHAGTPQGAAIDYLVMEHLEGETLAKRLEKRNCASTALRAAGEPPLRVEEALAIGAQIADALAAAHKRGIVHRDLKPANIMLTKLGGALQAKLLDFGLAKLKPAAAGVGLSALTTEAPATMPGAVMGTVPYMAPEQLEGKETDARTDLFAFGCVLYEMLTGRRAFAGETGASVISAIMASEPPPVSTLQPGTPPALERLVKACLAKDPDARRQSAHDVAEELRGIAQGAASSSVVRPARRARWGWWVAAAGALGVVAVVATFVVLRLLAPVRSTVTNASASANIRLAVLPFANLSGDPNQEYFADAMTNELITTLTQVRALGVTSFTSAMKFKGKGKSLPEIAAELKVEWFVEGTVQRAGNQLRVTAKLIRATADTPSWVETYDRDLRNILTLQGQMAQTLASQVGAQLTPYEQLRLGSARPISPDVFDLCIRGWQAANSPDFKGFDKAIRYFEQAVKADDSSGPAHAGLSMAYANSALFGTAPSRDALEKARVHATRAVQLDEQSADAHNALAIAHFMLDLDWERTDREFKRAIELAPNSLSAVSFYSWFLAAMGHFNEAIQLQEQVQELNPLSAIDISTYAWTLCVAGRHDKSIRQYERFFQGQPNDASSLAFLAWNCAETHRVDRVVELCKKAPELEPGNQQALGICSYSLAISGRRHDALAVLSRLTELSKTRPFDWFYLALAHAGVGNKAVAIELLERAVDERSGNAPLISLFFTRALGSEPRYQALLRKMNLPWRPAQERPGGGR